MCRMPRDEVKSFGMRLFRNGWFRYEVIARSARFAVDVWPTERLSCFTVAIPSSLSKNGGSMTSDTST